MHTRSLRDAPAGTLAVAVVLTGQLRSFGELAVQDSIVQLRRLFNRTDVFAFVSLVDSFSTAQTSASILGPRDPRSAGRNALGRKGCHRLLSDPKIRTAMAKLNHVQRLGRAVLARRAVPPRATQSTRWPLDVLLAHVLGRAARVCPGDVARGNGGPKV